MRALVVGPAAWNLLLHVDHLPDARPQTLFAGRSWEAVGGTSAGKALSLAALGHEVVLHTLLGDDDAGRDVREELAAAGVRLLADRSVAGTEQHVNLMAADGGRVSVYRTLAAASSALDLRAVVEEATRADVVLLDLSEHARSLVPLLAERRVPFWTDLHDWDGESEFHRPFAESAAAVVLSDDALEDPAAACEKLSGGTRLVVCTHGARGATAWFRGEVLSVPAHPVEVVVDTNGAGDAFTAGLVHGLHGGWPLVRALRAGALAGALAVGSERLVATDLTAGRLDDAPR